MSRLLPIVEGYGDLHAVPLLVRRVLRDHQIHTVQILRPHRRGDLPKVLSNFENYFRMAIKETAAILWVLDFDCQSCDCPKVEADGLYDRAAKISPNWPFRVAFMIKEYETLFLTDATSTRLLLNIRDSTSFPGNPETVRDAKGWLSQAMPRGFAYKPTIHQSKLTFKLNLSRLREASPSFRHFEKAILSLVDQSS
ncbi:MAG: DUF4276 family protein [Burkholderiales bacterium]